MLPPDTLVDGEIVICDDSGCVDFGALQARLGTARNTVATVARARVPDRACLTGIVFVLKTGIQWEYLPQ